VRVALLAFLVGCIDPVDQRWDLSHDHVVAVRADPPAVMPYQRAKLEALVAHRDGPVTIEAPTEAVGVDDTNDLVAFTGGWYVTAPSDETLAQLRQKAGVAADAPVPFEVVMRIGDFYATKAVLLGATEENPTIPAMLVGGTPAGDALVIPTGDDVYVSVAADVGSPAGRVNWLTSCGELFQDDVATAFLRAKEPCDGELAVVVRNGAGVAWHVWPLRAENLP